MLHTFNVIAADVQTAKAIAIKIAAGFIPDLYPAEADALAAWRGYPTPNQRRYIPFAVSLYTGEIDPLTKRLI